MEHLIEKYGDISVYWKPELDGGGRSFGQQFVPVVRNMVGKVERLFDFCAGAGFIGFSLLANGLCETLCLSDVNPDAVEAMRKTVKENDLADKVTVYQSDCLSNIPDMERWDLVVGNPPHFCTASDEIYKEDIIKFDPDWRIHKAFYRDVPKFLQPHGSVLLIENCSGSNESVFAPFLRIGGLEIVRSFMYCDNSELNPHYFLLSRRILNRVISCDKETTVLKVVASSVTKRFIEKRFDRFEKVQVDVINDLDYEVKIGLHTQSYGPDLIITVPAQTGKSSGVVLAPAGSLYISEIGGIKTRVCSRCEV